MPLRGALALMDEGEEEGEEEEEGEAGEELVWFMAKAKRADK